MTSAAKWSAATPAPSARTPPIGTYANRVLLRRQGTGSYVGVEVEVEANVATAATAGEELSELCVSRTLRADR